MFCKEDIINDLKQLDINKGDTVLVRGNLGRLGKVKGRNTFLDALLELIGTEGTAVTLGFSKTFPFYKVDKNFIFNKNSPSTTGALAKVFMKNDDCLRSKHPCSSFLAIGKDAKYIVKDHNETSLSYAPMAKLIELNAKMLIFGIVSDSPGFTTVHFAQEQLQLTRKTFLKNMFRVYYSNETNSVALFKRKDIGGCSRGFGKFYQHYLAKGILKSSKICNASALLVSSKEAYNIEYKLIEKDNSYHFCSDPLCFTCRMTWRYDLKYFLNCAFFKMTSKIFRR